MKLDRPPRKVFTARAQTSERPRAGRAMWGRGGEERAGMAFTPKVGKLGASNTDGGGSSSGGSSSSSGGDGGGGSCSSSSSSSGTKR